MRRFFPVLLVMVLLISGSANAASGDIINGLIRLPIPRDLTLCGEPVPLDHEDVLERLEYEMIVILGNAVQTSLWIKRAPRFFPEVERELAQRGLPDDLKYVAVIESSLRADAVSSAGAVGPWQFMPATGKEFGLGRDSALDQRREWPRSTRSALDYLKQLRDKQGSWALALAAYNCGPGRVRSSLDWQKTDNFYDLQLPEETKRYVFRFLATKLILGSPALYGLDLNQANLYSRLPVTPVTMEVKRAKVPVLALARAAGVSYRYFLELNPFLTGVDLPKGVYSINVPEGKVAQFQSGVEVYKTQPPAPAVATAKGRAKEASLLTKKAPPAPPPVPILTAEPPGQPILTNPPDQVAHVSAPPAAPSAAPAPATAQPAPSAEAQAAPPAQSERVVNYIVKKGDTLSGIAKQFAVKVDLLLNENGLAVDALLQPGQELAVPNVQ